MSDAPEFQYRGDYEEWLLAMLNPRRNQTQWRALVRALALACQQAEDLAWDVFLSNQLDNASGITLKYAGRKVGEEIGELTESEFRKIISARLRVMKTNGSPDDLLDILKAATGATSVAYYGGNAAFVLIAYRQGFMRDEYAARIKKLIRLGKPVGVSMEVIEAIQLTDAFHYDVGPGYDLGRYSRVL